MASEGGPNPEGAAYFSWFLVALASGILLLGIQQIRKRVTVLIQGQSVVAEQVGLFKRCSVWERERGESYYLLLAFREYKSRNKGRTSITRLTDLEIVNSDGKRHPLVRGFDEWRELRQLAALVAEALKLPSPIIIDLNAAGDEDTAYLQAHSRHLESERNRSLDEMKESVEQMKSARDQVQSYQDADDDLEDLKKRAVAEMDHGIANAEVEIRQAEFDISLDNFNKCEFVDCRPGDTVEYHSLDNSPSFTLGRILALPATTGMAILIFMVTPMVVPLTGQFLVSLLELFPFGVTRMQLHFALADLFQLDLRVFLWVPFLIALYILWTWLNVDASLAPFRARFDWSLRKLSVATRGATRIIQFSQVRALSIAIVHRKKRKKNGRTEKTRHYGLLFAELAGEKIALLELTRDAKFADDYEGTMDCFEPLASRLAESLNVSLHRLGWRKEKRNGVGFPYSYRVSHSWTIYRLAGTRG